MRVLIVDDHPVVVSGCRALLAAEPEFSVFEANESESGMAAFIAHAPDISVIDINLPGLSGFELLKRILAHDPNARVVMFSMNDDPAFVARALAQGAKGFITKNDDPSLFAAALKAVYAGDTYIPGHIAKNIFSNKYDDKHPELSMRELEIVRMLANGQSIYQIADSLGVSYKTVANNCTALKAKLGARTSMDLMRVALEYLSR